jgi:hypothetical protein
MRKVFAVVLIAVMAGGVPAVAAAKAARQSATGGAQGVAKDAQQQPLAKHTVQVRNVATGQLAATGTTSTAGEFAFSGLPEGTYVVEVVSAAGQMMATSAPFVIEKDRTAVVPLTSSANGALAGGSAAGFKLFGMNTVGTLAVLGGAAVGTTALVVTRNGKITICHKPTGTPAQTIEISENAKDSHLAHGDTMGACPASPAR